MDQEILEIFEREDQRENESLAAQIRVLERLVLASNRSQLNSSQYQQIKSQKRVTSDIIERDKKRMERKQRIVEYLQQNPGTTTKELADNFGLTTKNMGIILGWMDNKIYSEFININGIPKRRYYSLD
ncbi:MAG: winged helix-turn-helix transcriptional regulator [Nanoarchaeota archaeon]|nr:winged helix-turn-helix transcriptional regulator [Nanoarchaeota archaeon]